MLSKQVQKILKHIFDDIYKFRSYRNNLHIREIINLIKKFNKKNKKKKNIKLTEETSLVI